MKIVAFELKVAFVISTIFALVVFGLVVLFEFLGTVVPPSTKEIEKELLFSLAMVDLEIQTQMRFKENAESDTGTSKLDTLFREIVIATADTQIQKYEIIKKELVTGGIEILGSGWLAKKSFQAYQVANVLKTSEVAEALRKFGASRKLISRIAPAAWRLIRRAKVRAALVAVAATAAVVAAQEAGYLANVNDGISLWWKVGLPSGTFVLVFVGFLILVHFGVLD